MNELQAIVCFAVCMSATLVSSQFFGSYNNNFGGLGLNSIDGGDFGGANVFGSLNSRPNIRDPRQNRGKNKNTLPYYMSNKYMILFKQQHNELW